MFSFARTKEFPSSLKTRQKCAYTVLHCLWQMINYSKFPFSSLIHLSRERRGGKKKEIITLNCISKQQYLHARILSRPYGANDNLFCLDSAAIASPHCREKHCLGATPTSHDTRRLCFVVPWNWLLSRRFFLRSNFTNIRCRFDNKKIPAIFARTFLNFEIIERQVFEKRASV